MESSKSRSRGPKPFEFPPSPAGSPAMCSADDVISGGKLLPFCPPRSPPAEIGKTQVADSLTVGKAGYRRLRKEADPDPTRRTKVRWYVLAFRPVKVPVGMGMKEIRIRQQRKLASIDEEEEGKEGWGPWKLLRSLSCKGVEVAGDCHRRIVL